MTQSQTFAECEASEAEAPSVTFQDLGLSDELLRALETLKFHTPSDIQRELIPHALRGADCLGQAKTGTGKTAAFGLPMLDRLEPGGGVQGLVLVPTRELASQVEKHIRQLGAKKRLRTLAMYGGTRISDQQAKLKSGTEIVIGTPGRVLDMMSRRMLILSKIRMVVLDEVDRMLDIGFRDDIRKILRGVKSKHQTLFVSATIDDEIRRLARSFMHDPIEINVSEDRLTVDDVEQDYVSVDPRDKFKTLLGFLKHEKPKLVIVFTRTKATARRIGEKLKRANVKCKEIHGDLVQKRRERVMDSFRKSQIQVLVATDLASRGLDVMEISHIVNYDIPDEAAVYVHRVGRTARMGHKGYAVTFVTPEQGPMLTEIEMLINKQLSQLDAPWVIQREKPREEKPSAEERSRRDPAKRLRQPTSRDSSLDESGVQPVRRTLGSRFKPARSRR